MKEAESSVDPSVLLAACLPSLPRNSGRWRDHPFDEFCLITDGAVRVGLDGRKRKLSGDTLLLIRRGERHAYWNIPSQRPKFWVLFFKAGKSLYRTLPALEDPDPARRVWRLASAQAAAFKDLLVRLVAERCKGGSGAAMAQAAWLHLLMVMVQRWTESEDWVDVALPAVESEWIKFSEQINPGPLKSPEASELADFDWTDPKSMPERFKKIFGSSHYHW